MGKQSGDIFPAAERSKKILPDLALIAQDRTGKQQKTRFR